jgi:cytochrome c
MAVHAAIFPKSMAAVKSSLDFFQCYATKSDSNCHLPFDFYNEISGRVHGVVQITITLENHMKNLLARIVSVALLLAVGLHAMAADKGKPDEAQAMVKRAVELIKKEGRDKALAEFNNSKGSFIDRDMYIFVIDQKGTMLAHGTIARIVNKNVLDMKDADGNFLFKTMLSETGKKNTAWVHYKWPNPATKAIEDKSTYLEKIDDMIVGCGVYAIVK